jgi:vacuolar-type H+-ATPase subunit I/STV1
MFGDAGHGLIMAVFALCLIIFEKKLTNFKRGGEVGGVFGCTLGGI